VADTDPIETLRCAASAAPAVLPAATAEVLSRRYTFHAKDIDLFDVPVDSSIVASAREVLALAEQQQARPDTPAIALMRPDRKVVAVLDNPQFEESYQLVGIGEPVDGHRWARPSDLADWIPLVPAQNGDQ
jgi:hypothetical protein